LPVDHAVNPRCNAIHINSCAGLLEPNANCTPAHNMTWVVERPNRLCLEDGFCQRLHKELPADLAVSDVFGCALRLLLSPRPDFLSAHKFRFREGAETKDLSLAQIVARLERFHVIAVHIRLGDAGFANPLDGQSKHRTLWRNTLKCAQTLQSYLENRTASFANNSSAQPASWNDDLVKYIAAKDHSATASSGKPVRWLVFSDNTLVRDEIAAVIGNKYLGFVLEAFHPADVPEDLGSRAYFADQPGRQNKTRAVLDRELWAQWYALGLADDLVATDAYFRRMSAFAVSSWAYHLRPTWYSATTCQLQLLPSYGFLAFMPRTCHAGPHHDFPQPHLSFGHNVSVKFPQAWISRGDTILDP
jgi:hypothetical protein